MDFKKLIEHIEELDYILTRDCDFNGEKISKKKRISSAISMIDSIKSEIQAAESLVALNTEFTRELKRNRGEQ